MSVTHDPIAGYSHDLDWEKLAATVRNTFAARAGGLSSILTVNTEGLYDTYLDTLPTDRQTHVCHCCRRFFDRFAGLACIGQDGKVISALWDAADVPDFYAATVRALKAKVENRPIEGVFYDAEAAWGTQSNHDGKRDRDWAHFWVDAARLRYKGSPLLNGGRTARERLENDRICAQAAAAKLEDYKTVLRALTQRYTLAVCEEALRVLKSEALDRSERYIAPVQWLVDLHHDRAATSNPRIQQNVLWRAIADAPSGYCHPATSMSGNLLEDIANGVPFERARASFNAKVRGDRFQRSTTAPSAASLAEAEKLVLAMGLDQKDFRRRYARLEECQTLWTPKVAAKPQETTSGVFAGVASKEAGQGRMSERFAMNLPELTMTWEKFARTVLPIAEEIELLAPAQGDYMAVMTAVDPSTPPILKWDNNFSVYRYVSASSALQWKLRYGWTPVTGIVLNPTLWGDNPKPYLGSGLCLVLEGAVDTKYENACLFPEIMREELSNNAGIRRVIEAFSQKGTREEPEHASACGLGLTPNGACAARLKVRSGNTTTAYNIDRWD